MNTVLVSEIAKTIKQIRLQKQLSQEELAKLSSLDRTYISGIENRHRNITLDSLENIIFALGITPSVFFKILINNLDLGDKNEE